MVPPAGSTQMTLLSVLVGSSLPGYTQGSCHPWPRIALDTNPQRLERAGAFGADELVNPASDDPVEAIRELTHGRYADLTLDSSSSREARLAA